MKRDIKKKKEKNDSVVWRELPVAPFCLSLSLALPSLSLPFIMAIVKSQTRTIVLPALTPKKTGDKRNGKHMWKYTEGKQTHLHSVPVPAGRVRFWLHCHSESCYRSRALVTDVPTVHTVSAVMFEQSQRIETIFGVSKGIRMWSICQNATHKKKKKGSSGDDRHVAMSVHVYSRSQVET